ncbi:MULTISPECIES: MucR family transcriptional regulator [Sphingomonadaceae]|uniref:MucR family transcriptional regulator n=1 Tax=Sphingomonadales TaxID=204457 RepID=UPI000770201D|nr:MucR family transcriptional regulator [Sphingobium sp. TKS]AMK23186.1 MucR-family transcriptional regulator [Sphingobium sp. TKS]MCF8707579.1 MucR family transcriptional regulator [Rhizorhapis sp. SPR117]
MAEAEKPDLTNLTVELLSAYVSNNTVPSSELAELIRTTRAALGGEAVPAPPSEPEYAPAVSVRKSLASPDHIVSLIDGKPYRSLKRHLSSHGLTPNEYKVRFGLAKDYPMVAPGYSQQRREVAQRLGLGRKKAAAPTESAAPREAEAPVEAEAPAGPVSAPRARAEQPSRIRKAKTAPAAVAAVPPTGEAAADTSASATKARKTRPGKLATVKAKLGREGETPAGKKAGTRRSRGAAAETPVNAGDTDAAAASPQPAE